MEDDRRPSPSLFGGCAEARAYIAASILFSGFIGSWLAIALRALFLSGGATAKPGALAVVVAAITFPGAVILAFLSWRVAARRESGWLSIVLEAWGMGRRFLEEKALGQSLSLAGWKKLTFASVQVVRAISFVVCLALSLMRG